MSNPSSESEDKVSHSPLSYSSGATFGTGSQEKNKVGGYIGCFRAIFVLNFSAGVIILTIIIKN